MLKNYVISDKTMWFESKDQEILIREFGQDIIVENVRILTFINKSCLYYGCTYQGRKNGTKALINEEYKLPIIINDYNTLVFFPVNSCRGNRSIWINYNKIRKYYQISKFKVLVEFYNGESHTFLTSYYKFHNQILKCSRLIVVYNARKV